MSLRRYLLPSPADLLFLLFLFAVPLVRGHAAINTDGDLGRHIRVGETILNGRALFDTDRFSHTMAGQPFVPYEWLSEVTFALAHRMGGLLGVVILTGLLVAAAYALLGRFLSRAGVDPLTALLTATAAGATGAIHWLARPHLFTLLGAVLTLWLLELGGRRAPWLAVGLFAVWANLHGGFLYGLVLIALYLAGDMGESGLSGDRAVWRSRARAHLALGAGALTGTLLNPAGVGLLAHVTGYLTKSYLVDNTAEYQSPDFHAIYGRIFLVTLVAVVGMLAVAGRRPSLPVLLTVLVNVAFALSSIRNIPLFALTALPLAVLHLARTRDASGAPLWGRTGARFAEAGKRFGSGAWTVAGGTVMLALFAGPARGMIPGRFDPAVFPVEAVARARAAALPGPLFNEFEWGGYVLYAWPEQPVFIDGQTDFYGEALTREYALLRAAQGEWRHDLQRRGVRLVLLRANAPLLQRLARERGWESWYSDRLATIMIHEPQ